MTVKLIMSAMIILQVSVAVMAILHYVRRGSIGWSFVSAGFFLMAFRRVTALLSTSDSQGSVQSIDHLYLPLSISILMFLGILKIRGEGALCSRGDGKCELPLGGIQNRLKRMIDEMPKGDDAA